MAGVWEVGNSISSARRYLDACGGRESTIQAGGYTGSIVTTSQKFNGASWSSASALNAGRAANAMIGDSTAALSAGGEDGSGYATNTEEYGGSSWASVSKPIGNDKAYMGAAGSQSSGIIAGGTEESSGDETNEAETFNGTSWSSITNMPASRERGTMFGAQNAAHFCGGRAGATTHDDVYKWSGSAWSTEGTMNSNRQYPGSAGVENSALVFGAATSGASSEEYNGTTWSAGGDLNTGRSEMGGTGANIAEGLSIGGYTGTYSNVVELYELSFIPLVMFM